MKETATFESKGRFSSRLTPVLAALCVAVVCQSPGQIVPLNDGNSTALINAGNQQGMFNWTVDGINQLYQQWFWYRVGPGGREFSINTIGAPAIMPLGPNAATITYNNGLYSVSTTYTLRGGLPGSRASDIGESIVINNLTGAALDFHFFQYSDFTLAGTPQNDFTVLAKSGITGLYNEAAVWDANFMLKENVDTTASPGANHGDVQPIGVTLGALSDGLATTLNDVAGPAGPSYNTWALEWDLNIGAYGSVIISKDKNLQAVPEPSALGLVLLGLVVCGVRVYRRRA